MTRRCKFDPAAQRLTPRFSRSEPPAVWYQSGRATAHFSRRLYERIGIVNTAAVSRTIWRAFEQATPCWYICERRQSIVSVCYPTFHASELGIVGRNEYAVVPLVVGVWRNSGLHVVLPFLAKQERELYTKYIRGHYARPTMSRYTELLQELRLDAPT